MFKKTFLLTLALLLLAALAACQSASQTPSITVEEAWGRASPAVAANGAFYMKIRNSGGAPDRLLSASSSVCGVVELHEMSMMNDVMEMSPVESIAIPANSTVELKVGGLHVMCIDKQVDFSPGARYSLTLNFETSGAITVEAEIRQP
jgi:periplasmic copper chaperone A